MCHTNFKSSRADTIKQCLRSGAFVQRAAAPRLSMLTEPLAIWVSAMEGCAHLQQTLDWQPASLNPDMFWAVPTAVDGVDTLAGKLGDLHVCAPAPTPGGFKYGITFRASTYLAPEAQPTTADGRARAPDDVRVKRTSPTYGAGLILQGILFQCEAALALQCGGPRLRMCGSVQVIACAVLAHAPDPDHGCV